MIVTDTSLHYTTLQNTTLHITPHHTTLHYTFFQFRWHKNVELTSKKMLKSLKGTLDTEQKITSTPVSAAPVCLVSVQQLEDHLWLLLPSYEEQHWPFCSHLQSTSILLMLTHPCSISILIDLIAVFELSF